MYERLGYSRGKMLEDEMLGDLSSEAKEKYLEYASITQNFNFMEAIRVIETCERKDCINPKKYYTRRLRQEVAKMLNLDIENDPYSVEFYVSVGTMLDRNNGVDAFFSIKEPGTKFNARVTIDITANDKKDKHKADIIAFFPNGSLDETNKEEKEELEENIQRDAKLIVAKVLERKESYFKKRAA